MRKSNIYAFGNQRKVNPNWFTGSTFLKDISSVIQSKEQDIYHVYFKNGSKTKLHIHNGSQILIVTQGKGRLEFFKKSSTGTNFKIKKTESISLNLGDIVYIPKNTIHTHGSANKKIFSHIAINILPKKNTFKTVWYESNFRNHTSGIIR
jgi:quercetin dioxygenase-like cupin family protein